jgi:hypothetical protein
VVSENFISEVLRDLYSDPKIARNNIVSFHSRIKDFVHGISESKVKGFLKNQQNYHVFVKKKKKLSQSIVTYKPLDQIQMDYIDLQKLGFFNLSYFYCLVLIDIFSKYL